MFNVHNDFDLSSINRQVLERWQAAGTFGRSITEREGAPRFVFFEGPPSANGMPGIHHVLARTIKDLVCRYKTMKGYQVNRRAGWDTHGLPVELGVEKNLGITKEDIGRKISVDDYNAACRNEVMKYTNEWATLTNAMGYWVDLDSAYITYDNRYIESVWWLLSQLYKKGYLYKGYTIQPYSPAAGTGLSSHELNQPGCYHDVKDTTCIAEFLVTDPTECMKGWGEPFFLAWTTTPWTLPSNTALCVGPNIDYCVVRTYNPYSASPITIVMAEALLGTVLGEKGRDLPLEGYAKGDKVLPWSVVGRYKGTELVGMHYEQLFKWVNPGEGAFRVIPGDYVSTDDGTGIVHIAGTFGADDNRVSRQNGIPPLHLTDADGNIRPMVDLKGKFYEIDRLDPQFVAERVDTALYSQWAGRYVKNAFDPERADDDPATLDIDLCMDLKLRDRVFRIEKHVHSYPHCWRTDKPVLYYPLDSWFIRSTAARERLMELNQSIKWKPASIGTGRFGKWLENLQDWNLSRSRYWGTPLPIWRTEDGAEEICIESVEQLYNEIDRAVEAGVMKSNPLRDKGFVPGKYAKDNYELIDLHRPYVDDIVLVSAHGKPMHRETDLIDVWFDSGAMPYAQIHYPFENKEDFESGKAFPADFIAEGVDQTRGWFFTLHAIAGMIFDSPAYKAVISNGLVLDKMGNKMSKRLGNAVDPFKAIAEFGADPVRWYMISNSAPWDSLKYDSAQVAEVSRKFFSTLYNTYKFFAPYANVDGFTATESQVPMAERQEIDRWIISVLNSLIATVTEALDDYEPTRAARAIQDFVIDDLSNWYVRLNRKRFWGGGLTTDKLAAYQTLYTCLLTVSRLMAPIAPFYADQLYTDLTAGVTGAADSVHLDRFPEADTALIDKALEQRMHVAQQLTSMALALRKQAAIKVRQPLACMLVPADSDALRADIESMSHLICSEINVKELRITGSGESVLVKRVKPNFKLLGPKFGKLMKQAAAKLTSLSQPEIAAFEAAGTISIEGIDVTLADVEIFSEDVPGWLVTNDGTLTVALDITLTDELRREGLAREIVNRVQNIRKTRDYDITDRITLTIAPNEATDATIAEYSGDIASQVLATAVVVADVDPEAEGSETLDIDGLKLIVNITPN